MRETGSVPQTRSKKTRWYAHLWGSLIGSDPAAARQSMIALTVAALTSVAAGLTLSAIRGRLEELPGMLVMVPAAIAMRGNIYGAMGNRLSTAIHTGRFNISRRTDTVVGQNVLAAGVVTLATSVALAVMAKLTAVAFGLANTISFAEFITISVVGGILSSVVLMAATLALARSSTRRSWDLDNVLAPIMSAAGDVITLPALFLASELVGWSIASEVIALAAVLGVAASLRWVARSDLEVLRTIVRESIPILLLAALLGVVAGLVIEKRFAGLSEYPVLLILVPAFLGTGGAIGGILSSKLATKLHLGLVSPASWPDEAARVDVVSAFLLAMPMFLGVALLSNAAGWMVGAASPGFASVVAVALMGGFLTTILVVAIGYYGTIAAWRFGVDPDTYGFPLVTASVDLIGAYMFVLSIVALGLV
jgi:mgtE-like transporter